jgi:flagellar protein FlaG
MTSQIPNLNNALRLTQPTTQSMPPEFDNPMQASPLPPIEESAAAKNHPSAFNSDDSSQANKTAQRDEMNTMVDDINQFAQSIDRELNFVVGENGSINELVIEVRDRHTQELIRQIPSEDAVKIAQSIRDAEQGFGLIFNKKV